MQALLSMSEVDVGEPPTPPEKVLVLGIIHQAINDVERNKAEKATAMKWILESRGPQSLIWWCELIGDASLASRVRARAIALSIDGADRGKKFRTTYRRDC